MKRTRWLIASVFLLMALWLAPSPARASDSGGISIAVSTVIVNHVDLTLVAGAAAVQVCPATQSTRIACDVQNVGNVNNARCGDNTTGATSGHILGPDLNVKNAGGAFTFATTAAVFCYSASGTTISATEYLR